MVANHPQVHVPVQYPLDYGPGVADDQLHMYAGIHLTEPPHYDGKHVLARSGAGAQQQMAGLEVLHLLDGVHQLLGEREYLLGVSQDRVTRFGDPQTARPPVKEGDAQELLQLLDLDRHRGLGDFHRFGRPREAQVVRDHLEDV